MSNQELDLQFKPVADLGVSRSVVQAWEASGILTPTQIGTAHVYPRKQVERLQRARNSPLDAAAPGAWIVRLSEPGRESDGHPIGWEEGRADNVDAARKFWKVARPDDAAGEALVAAVGPLVVGVWQITGGFVHEDFGPTGRAEFLVTDATERQNRAYLNRWLPVGRGPVVLRWPRP